MDGLRFYDMLPLFFIFIGLDTDKEWANENGQMIGDCMDRHHLFIILLPVQVAGFKTEGADWLSPLFPSFTVGEYK